MKSQMRPCHVIEIVTPKKYLLRGLWFGSTKAKHVVIFIHGLSGSAFSMSNVLDRLVDRNTAVLTFNNRGFEWISTLRRRLKKDSERGKGGAAHEIFTDSVDDIDGAVTFVRRRGAKNIFLAGHSTGCQKSIYWASERKNRTVKGIILLGPISDYEAELHRQGKAKIIRALSFARMLVGKGKKHTLLKPDIWHEVVDAQRFLSLYDPESPENIFPYGRTNKNPKTLKSIELPILVLWAENDEFADRPSKEIVAWFDKNIRAPHQVVIVPKVGHGFKGGEKLVAKSIREFMLES